MTLPQKKAKKRGKKMSVLDALVVMQFSWITYEESKQQDEARRIVWEHLVKIRKGKPKVKSK